MRREVHRIAMEKWLFESRAVTLQHSAAVAVAFFGNAA